MPLVAAVAFAAGCGRLPEPSQYSAEAERTRAALPGWSKPSQVPARRVLLPAGTTLRVRLAETIATDSSRAGDEFTAVVVDPVEVDGRTVIPGGAEVRGFVQKAVEAVAPASRAVIALGLRSLDINNTRVELDTDSVTRVGAGRGGEPAFPADAGQSGLRIPAQTILDFRLREPVTL